MRHICQTGCPATTQTLTATDRVTTICRGLFVILLRAYRLLLSPFLGNNCRFYPSCSCYAETAIARHGVFKGGWLALRRLGKCHPWHEGGLDPVPGCSNPTSTEH